jgi:transcriptional regulator with XRE-family HTH domain
MSTRSRDQGPLGRRLSYLRWEANLSRDEVAHRAGISRDLLQMLEQGRHHNPTLRVLIGLAMCFKISIGTLLEKVVDHTAAPVE